MSQVNGSNHWQKQRGLSWPWAWEVPRGRGGEHPAPDGMSWTGSQGREEADQKQMLPGRTVSVMERDRED